MQFWAVADISGQLYMHKGQSPYRPMQGSEAAYQVLEWVLYSKMEATCQKQCRTVQPRTDLVMYNEEP